MLSDHDDTPSLDVDLRLCREELARAREHQEPLEEMLADERFRRQTLERLVERLADDLDRWLVTNGREYSFSARLRRLVTRGRAQFGDEHRQAQRLRDSGLFSNAWYLTHYPDALESGLPPAVHYLRFGARSGHNPGPAFNTRAYLKGHPGVAKSGQNALLHYLEHTGLHDD